MRKRILGLLIVAMAVVAVYTYLGPKLPKDQIVHLVLGSAAPLATEVVVRYRPEGETEWAREVTFEYAQGAAPRIVTHEARLPDGDYFVEIDVARGSAHTVVERKVKLGGTTSIELESALSPKNEQ
jgi:hypothetical protein